MHMLLLRQEIPSCFSIPLFSLVTLESKEFLVALIADRSPHFGDGNQGNHSSESVHLYTLFTRFFKGRSSVTPPFMCYEGGVQWCHSAYHQIGLEKPNVSIQTELDLAEDSAEGSV